MIWIYLTGMIISWGFSFYASNKMDIGNPRQSYIEDPDPFKRDFDEAWDEIRYQRIHQVMTCIFLSMASWVGILLLLVSHSRHFGFHFWLTRLPDKEKFREDIGGIELYKGPKELI